MQKIQFFFLLCHALPWFFNVYLFLLGINWIRKNWNCNLGTTSIVQQMPHIFFWKAPNQTQEYAAENDADNRGYPPIFSQAVKKFWVRYRMSFSAVKIDQYWPKCIAVYCYLRCCAACSILSRLFFISVRWRVSEGMLNGRRYAAVQCSLAFVLKRVSRELCIAFFILFRQFFSMRENWIEPFRTARSSGNSVRVGANTARSGGSSIRLVMQCYGLDAAAAGFASGLAGSLVPALSVYLENPDVPLTCWSISDHAAFFEPA